MANKSSVIKKVILSVCLTTEEINLIEKLINEIKDNYPAELKEFKLSPRNEKNGHNGDRACAFYDIFGSYYELVLLINLLKSNGLEFINRDDIVNVE